MLQLVVSMRVISVACTQFVFRISDGGWKIKSLQLSIFLYLLIFLVHLPYVGHYVVTVCRLNSPLLMTSGLGPQRERESHSFLLSYSFRQEMRVSASTERKNLFSLHQLFHLIHKLLLNLLTQTTKGSPISQPVLL